MTEEEGEQQGVNMASVHIGVGHDNDAMVAQFAQVKSLTVFFGAPCHSKGCINIAYFFTFKDAVFLCFFHVQDLTAQRQDGLERSVTTALSRTACGISFYKKDLALFRVTARTVGKLAGKTGSGHHGFALYQFARLSGGVTGSSGQDDFVNNSSGIFRVLFQVIIQGSAHGLRNCGHNFAVPQFGLGLALELRLVYLNRYDSGKPFTEIGRINIEFKFAQHA